MLHVARDLLGCYVLGGDVVVRLTEVEAYGGADDPASHAFRAATRRNAVMFGPPGYLYVYFTYGMHYCANLVTGPEGVPGAVLLRAGEVVAGSETARERRRAGSERDMATGPARLAKALGLDLSQNGADVTERNGAFWVAGGALAPDHAVVAGPRVGITSGTVNPWRFSIVGDRTVSRFRPGVPRRPGRTRPVKSADDAIPEADTPDL